MLDMAGTTDLAQLLRTLEPVLRDGEFVYATVVEVPAGLPVEATVREPEGLTIVVRRDAAVRPTASSDECTVRVIHAAT